jgi:hypothetical protein
MSRCLVRNGIRTAVRYHRLRCIMGVRGEMLKLTLHTAGEARRDPFRRARGCLDMGCEQSSGKGRGTVSRILARLIVVSVLALPTVSHGDESVPCLKWCAQCNAGPACTADCLIENQPMRPATCSSAAAAPAPSSTAKHGIPCNDWCAKCKPDDHACPGRCDKQHQPIMTRACPAH